MLRSDLRRIFRSDRAMLVRQSSASECGLACLGMILAHHGAPVPLHDLRLQYPTSRKGMTLRTLITIASQLGLVSRAVKLEPPALAHLALPAMLHWELNHFVVLSRVSRKGGYILDPARGSGWVSKQEIAERFSGIAVEFTPAANFLRRRSSKHFSIFDLCERARGIVSALGITLTLSVLLQILLLIVPLFLQIIVDRI